MIDNVDLGLKDNLRRLLYEEKQRDALSDSINLLDLDDEDILPPGPIAPGLPPASSDRSKWWLDNGRQHSASFSHIPLGFITDLYYDRRACESSGATTQRGTCP